MPFLFLFLFGYSSFTFSPIFQKLAIGQYMASRTYDRINT